MTVFLLLDMINVKSTAVVIVGPVVENVIFLPEASSSRCVCRASSVQLCCRFTIGRDPWDLRNIITWSICHSGSSTKMTARSRDPISSPPLPGLGCLLQSGFRAPSLASLPYCFLMTAQKPLARSASTTQRNRQ